MTQEQCDFCDHAKRVLEKLQDEFALAVETLDLATAEGRALAQASGFMFPPGVLVDGEPFSYGRLSERKLRRALARAHGRSRG